MLFVKRSYISENSLRELINIIRARELSFRKSAAADNYSHAEIQKNECDIAFSKKFNKEVIYNLDRYCHFFFFFLLAFVFAPPIKIVPS